MNVIVVEPGPTALVEARDTVRQRLAAGDVPAGGLIVELKPGDYALTEPLQLDHRDGGTADAPVVWRGANGGRVRLLGGVLLQDITPVTDASVRQRLSPTAVDNVLQVDLGACGIIDFGAPVAGGLELFFDGAPMSLARWPKQDFVRIAGLVGGDPVDVRGTVGDRIGRFHYDGQRPARWVDEADPWVHGYWFWDWSDQRHRIESIDAEAKIISVQPPYHNYGYRTGQWFYAYNLLCELDQPGEFYVDRQKGMLYFWPPAPLTGVELAVSVADTLVTLDGTSHVQLEGLRFEYGRGTAVTMSDADHIGIQGCTFRNLGAWAVRVDGGNSVVISHSEVEATGGGGIFLHGGDRPALRPGNHAVEDCHIHHYGRVNRMYQPAVQISGVGQRVAHNHIHDAPHMAIQFAGNDHVIEFNDVHHVCQESNDAGAVYSGRDWTWRGTVIRYNKFWEITGFEDRGCVGVYLDDMLCGTHVHGNLFWRVTRATMIGGGRDCVFENNIYIDCTPCVHLDARAMNWAAYHVDTTMKERLDEMPIHDAEWARRYPELLTLWQDDPAAPKGNIIRRNLCQGGEFDGVRDDAREFVDLVDNLVADDIGLEGTPPHSFSLRQDAAAWALGFVEIPEDAIGPRR